MTPEPSASAITDVPEPRWWQDHSRVTHRLAGVFEGGGAKGVAFAGALEATLGMHCWFGAVAGASAGAITAALIAAGLDPFELDAQSRIAFERLRPASVATGLKQLRLNLGYLDNRSIREWLEDVLSRQVRRYGIPVEGAVTFAMLYQATGIELNVVAADLSRGRQIVFSVWDTPGVQVADAVLASSSIPFVFAPRHLRVGTGGGAYVHTLVDGGVWSNFPMFVFTDASFRRASGRPELVAEDYIVGYLLDEQASHQMDLANSSFVQLDDTVTADEWRPPSAVPNAVPPKQRRRALEFVTIILTSPLWLLLRLGAWLSLGGHRSWKGRWPDPPGLAGLFLRMVDDALGALHTGWFAGIAALALVGGSTASIYWLVTSFLLLRADEIRLDLVFGDPVSAAREVIQVVLVTIVLGLIVTVTLLVLVVLAANYLLLGPIRHVFAGVLRTYAAGPGAPTWAGVAHGDHVLRLPIPPDLKTLSFDRTVPVVAAAIEKAIADAREATLAGLASVLAHEAINGPARPKIESTLTAAASSPTPGIDEGERWVALRVTAVATAIAIALFVGSLVLPTPPWKRFDVNVRVCQQVLQQPDDACDTATPGATAVSVLFGPSSAGHVTQATMTVDGRIVGSSTAKPNPESGRIVSLPIDWDALCGQLDCTIKVEALVDGEAVFHRTIRRQINLDWN